MDKIVSVRLLEVGRGALPLSPGMRSDERRWAARVLASVIYQRRITADYQDGAVISCVTELSRGLLEELGFSVLADPAFGQLKATQRTRWVRLYSPITADDWGHTKTHIDLTREQIRVLQELAPTHAPSQ